MEKAGLTSNRYQKNTDPSDVATLEIGFRRIEARFICANKADVSKVDYLSKNKSLNIRDLPASKNTVRTKFSEISEQPANIDPAATGNPVGSRACQ